MDVSSLQIPVEDVFGLLCQNKSIGYWISDVQHKKIWWSDTCFDLIGLEDKNKVPSLEEFLDFIIHPEDRFIGIDAIKRYLYYHKTSDKSEVRLKNNEGFYDWFEISSEAKYDAQNNLQFVLGTVTNIAEKMQYARELDNLKLMLDVAEDMLNVGIYERNFETGQRIWSKKIYDVLEIPHGTFWTIEQLLNRFTEEDKKVLVKATEELRTKKQSYDLELQLTTTKGNRFWVRALAKPIVDGNDRVTGYRGVFQKTEGQKQKEDFLIDIRNRIKEQNFFLDESSALSHIGSWEYNIESKSFTWSKQTRQIYEVDENFEVTLESMFQFYPPSSQKNLSAHFCGLLESAKPYDLELEMITAAKNKIWVRSIGKPVIDESGNIVKLRGIIQDITDQKDKEIELNAALSIINGQNDRLKDFTYIVSHNLRSHAGNLEMITGMIDIETDNDIKLEWMNHVKNVSVSLCETVNNLNGLVTLNIENKKCLSFAEIFDNVQKAISYKLINEEVKLTADFSACEQVDYVPAYLESIMLNLITNAIKYRHPERKPIISLQTSIENGRPLLKVTDNGLGIDLKLYETRLFKMNQTFHQNSDARGIGLYITKNMVENMGGSIEVDSTVGEGSTFTIHF